MKAKTNRARPGPWCAAVLAALLAAGCAEDADPAPDEGASPTVQVLPTWDEFLADSTVVVDGRELYVVEWDLPIDSREELRAYYDELVRRHDAAESGETADGVGSSSQPLLINRVNGQDDVWTGPTPGQLTYCVSNTFAADQARMVEEMARATSAWSRVANVSFVYVPAQNGSCFGTSTAIRIAVRPWNAKKARSFFPSDVRGDLWIDVPYFDNNAPGGAPNVTTEGVLRHELGHILGFRHEHNAEPTGLCYEDPDWRALTEYDVDSVMHYPWCNGVITSDLRITPRDERGAATAYGMAIAPLLEILDD